jgi:uncharacterized YigZ family protein
MSIAEFKDRGSRFIAYAFPIKTAQDFKNNLNELKKEHPKAVHHCFAYRIGTTKDIFRANDDGEPSGTAGKPILGQIDSKNLTDLAVIVVRYFGGTLLGVPGLINAYKTATALALQTTPIVQKPITSSYALQFNYEQLHEIMKILKNAEGEVLKQDLGLFAQIDFSVPKSRSEEVIFRLKDFPNVELSKLLPE